MKVERNSVNMKSTKHSCYLSALSRPTDYDEFHSEDQWLQSTLLAFTCSNEFSEQGKQIAHLDGCIVDWQHFLYPPLWLRVMLRRSAVSIASALDSMLVTTLLGELDIDYLCRYPLWRRPGSQIRNATIL